jgi:hypothetical protein
MTRRRGSFRRFMRGLTAAYEAELPMRINIVVSNRNAHEIPQMKVIADRYGIPSFEYTNISPTIHGGGEVLPSQSREMLRKRKPYTGCNAGITHFHVDPHGKASICKVGRDPQVDLIAVAATPRRRQNNRRPAFPRSLLPTRPTSTYSPQRTSGYGQRSRLRARAPGLRRWREPRSPGRPTARLTRPAWTDSWLTGARHGAWTGRR